MYVIVFSSVRCISFSRKLHAFRRVYIFIFVQLQLRFSTCVRLKTRALRYLRVRHKPRVATCSTFDLRTWKYRLKRCTHNYTISTIERTRAFVRQSVLHVYSYTRREFSRFIFLHSLDRFRRRIELVRCISNRKTISTGHRRRRWPKINVRTERERERERERAVVNGSAASAGP